MEEIKLIIFVVYVMFFFWNKKSVEVREYEEKRFSSNINAIANALVIGIHISVIYTILNWGN